MKLISVNENPIYRKVFCELGHRLLPSEDRSYSIQPEFIHQILGLPFNVDSEAYLMESDSGEFVGRIFLHTSLIDKALGHFGFFLISPEKQHQSSFLELIPQIDEWFKKRNIKKVIGPFLFTTFFPYRFRSDSHPEKFYWEPNQPQNDLLLFYEAGFKDEHLYHTSIIDGLADYETKGEKDHQKLLEMGYKVREISNILLDQDLKIIYDLTMKGFGDNILFVPISFDLFKHLYTLGLTGLDYRCSSIWENPEGVPVSFQFSFVENNNLILKTACVDPQFRGLGLMNAGFREAVVKAKSLYSKINKVIPALYHEDNGPSSHLATISPLEKRHSYVLVKKDLT